MSAVPHGLWRVDYLNADHGWMDSYLNADTRLLTTLDEIMPVLRAEVQGGRTAGAKFPLVALYRLTNTKTRQVIVVRL